MAEPIQIGPWSFSPDVGALERDGQSKRLESRAAEVLAMLCEQRGALITHDDLVARVWKGRALSRNSVAVVIGDLRRALEDDARTPLYIETVPKRGYRLIAAGEQHAQTARTSVFPIRMIGAAALATAAIAVAGLVVAASGPRGPTPIELHVTTFANDTSNPALDPLTISVEHLVAVELTRLPQINVVQHTDDALSVRGSLIMWEGHPSVSLFVENPQTGEVIWSGMAAGPEASIPAQIRTEVSEFGAQMTSNEFTTAQR